jgi:hypothetical protein
MDDPPPTAHREPDEASLSHLAPRSPGDDPSAAGAASAARRAGYQSQGLVVASPVWSSMPEADAMTPTPESTAIRANPPEMSLRPTYFLKTSVSCFHWPGVRVTVYPARRVPSPS